MAMSRIAHDFSVGSRSRGFVIVGFLPVVKL
jgi:hypothetical protein